MDVLIWLVIAALSVIPLFKLLPHFGIHKYWAFVAIVPIGAVAMLWWMAIRLQRLEQG